MKFCRFGAKGAEQPGVIDAQGRVRDLSAQVPDLTVDRLAQLVTIDRMRLGRRCRVCEGRKNGFGQRQRLASAFATNEVDRDIEGNPQEIGLSITDRGYRRRRAGNAQPRFLNGLFRHVDRAGPTPEDREQRAPLPQVDAGKIIGLRRGSRHVSIALPNTLDPVVPTAKYEGSRHIFMLASRTTRDSLPISERRRQLAGRRLP